MNCFGCRQKYSSAYDALYRKLLFRIEQRYILRQTVLTATSLDTDVKGVPVSSSCADDVGYAERIKGRDSLDIRRRCQSFVYCKARVFSSWKRAMQSKHFCRVPGRAGPCVEFCQMEKVLCMSHGCLRAMEKQVTELGWKNKYCDVTGMLGYLKWYNK